MILPAVAGLTAGVVGAIVWAFITYQAGWELGIIAWLIGAAVGGAALLVSDRTRNVARGIIAVAIAAISIISGKFAVEVLYWQDFTESYNADLRQAIDHDTDFAISFVADDAYAEDPDLWKDLDWPYEIGAVGNAREDYPPELWTLATERWDAMSDAEQEAYKDDAYAISYIAEDSYTLALDNFRDAFTLFDLLWFGLAMFSAYRLAAGTNDDC
jgi:phosphate/sulfate permease